MKSTIIRKAIAILVSVTMVVGLTPIYAYADAASAEPSEPNETSLVAGSFAEDPSISAQEDGASAMALSAFGAGPITTWSTLKWAVLKREAGSTVELGGNIIGSKNDDRIIIAKDITIDLKGYTLSHGLSECKSDGHVIEVLDGATLTIKDSSAAGTGKITGGYSTYGGGIYVDKGATLILRGGTITGNHADKDGGGIYVDGYLDTYAGVISSNDAGVDGGGIYVTSNGRLDLMNTTVTTNTAKKKGGGINLHQDTSHTSYLRTCTITGNKSSADCGGGLYMNETGAKLKITNTAIEGNKSLADCGGGIYLYDGAIEMERGSISNNTAKITGGGIETRADTTFKATGTAINNNTATTSEGGGIENFGTAELANCTISGNNAKADGGGICNGQTLTLNGGSVTNNTAANGMGHGIFVCKSSDATNIQGGLVVADNGSSASKQQVYLRTGKKLKVTGAFADGARIGVTMEDGVGDFTTGYRSHHKVTTYTDAPGLPGGKGIATVSYIDPATYFFSPDGLDVMLGSLIGDVQLASAWGVLQAEINSKATTGGTVTLNRDYKAKSDDDRLTIPEGTTVTIDLAGHTLDRGLSACKSNGHVIEVLARAKLTIRDTSAAGTGKITGGFSKYGGGIYVNAGAKLDFYGGTITSNHAATSGGGVYSAGDLDSSGGVIDRNTALLGGGICMADDGGLDLANTAITNNTAGLTGGGIYAARTGTRHSSISGCTISYNKALAFSGGGLFMDEEHVTLDLDNTTFDHNQAKKDGGGICLQYGEIKTDGGLLSGNISSDGEGGAVRVTPSTVFKADGVSICENQALSYDGGGVANEGKTTLENCTISKNYAKEDGGGISNDKNGDLTLENCTVERNEADLDAGGIFTGATLALKDVTITKNSAAHALGNGIYVGKNSDKTTIQGKVVVEGNGTPVSKQEVYLRSGKVLELSGALTDGARIGVTMEDGTGIFTTGYRSKNGTTVPSTYFFSPEGLDVSLLIEARLASTWNALQAEINTKAATGGTVTLSRDYTASSKDDRLTIPKDKAVTIDLAGHTLDRNLTSRKSNGHVIEVLDGAELTIIDSSAEGTGKMTGGYSKYGGSIYVNAGAILNLKGGTVTGNHAMTAGAGIYVAGTLNMSGGAVAGNDFPGIIPSGAGGGIYVTGTLNMTGGSITGNTAFQGGGIYVDSNGSASLKNAAIAGNKGSIGGGLLLLRGSSIENCAITGNEADGGGGLYMNAEGETLTIMNTVFESNVASAGGGMCLAEGTTTMSGGALRSNIANAGGGVAANDDATLTMTGVEIRGNRATGGNGGGVVNEGKTTLTNCIVTDNTATQSGGGIASEGELAIVGGTIGASVSGNGEAIAGNTAQLNGGGVYIDKGAETTSIKGAIVMEGNTATLGNDLYLGKGQKLTVTDKLTGTRVGYVDMQDPDVFTEHYGRYHQWNVAGNEPGNFFGTGAGAVLVTWGSQMTEAKLGSAWSSLQQQIKDTPLNGTLTIDGDYTANIDDDRLIISKNITIDLAGHTLDRNRASRESDGHVIEVLEGATLTIVDEGTGKITGGFSKYGGGIYVNERAILNLKGGTITGNVAQAMGGGVYLEENASFNLMGGAVSSNIVLLPLYGQGGGVYVEKGADFNLMGGSVSNNNAICQGGGIFVRGTLDMTGGVVTGNEAGGGGGIYVTSSGTIDLCDGVIANNAARSDGAGIYASLAENAVIEDCLIGDNSSGGSGGGLYLDAKGKTLKIKGTRIVNNSADDSGAGVYLHNGTIEMHRGSLSGNTATCGAGGIEVTESTAFSGDRVAINDNRAVTEAGGAMVNAGTAELEDCAIIGNNAQSQGGGISNVGELTLDGCTVSGNNSEASGGGVFSAKTLTITDSVIGTSTSEDGEQIPGNTAQVRGGGLFVGSEYISMSGAEYTTTSIGGAVDINGNEAGISGDNAFVRMGQRFTVQKALTSDAKIGVDLEGGAGVLTHKYAIHCKKVNGLSVVPDDPREHFVFATGLSVGLTVGEVELKTDWESIKSKIESAKNGDTIKLDKDYAASLGDEQILIDGNKSVTVDLNGHVLNRNQPNAVVESLFSEGTTKDGRVFEVMGQSTLTIKDGSAGKTGAVTGGWAKNGGGIYVNEGAVLNIESGSVAGNRATNNGGGVFAGGTVNVLGGTVEANKAEGWGGGIFSAVGDKTHGVVNMKGGTVRANEAAGSGGGIGLENGSMLYFEAGTIADNIAEKNGGGIALEGGAASIVPGASGGSEARVYIKGSPIVHGNTASDDGNDIYLPSLSKLDVSGAFAEGAWMGVSKQEGQGVFTSGYGAHNGGIDPAQVFSSTQGYPVYEQSGEAVLGQNTYGETDQAYPFIDRNNQVNTNPSTVSSQNWMSAISGERYLNEINMPGAHDAGMRNVEDIVVGDWTSVVSSIGYAVGGFYATTQTRYIDKQLEAGARQLDIRLNNRYKKSHWYGYTWADDYTNLWICHGTSSTGGTYFAEDDQGNLLSFTKVLKWIEDFLEEHPTETVILNIRPETMSSSDNEKIYERTRNILAGSALRENPSTGEPFLYKEEGSDDYFAKYSHIPQLKDCRGKIVLMPNDKMGRDYCGGFSKDSFELELVAPTDYTLTRSEKVVEVESAYDTLNGDGSVEIPVDPGTEFNLLWYWELNCTGEDQGIPKNYTSGINPVKIAQYVNPRLIGDDKLFGPERAGQYIGWVRLDAFAAKYAEPIWRTNFFERLQYCTVTVDSGLGAPYDTQSFTVLKGTTVEVPGNIYKSLPKGTYLRNWKAKGEVTNVECEPGDTIKINEDVTFTAQWLTEGEIPVKVAWKDADDADKLRPRSLNLDVTVASGQDGETTTTQMTLSSNQGWSGIASGAIESIAPNWDRIVPTDANPQGQDAAGQYRYETSLEDGDGYTFTLIHTPQEKADIAGTVFWDDGDNAERVRPANVTIHLLCNGEEVDSLVVSQVVDDDEHNDWSYDFGECPQYVNGEKVVYSVAQDRVDGYSTTVDGFSVTNTRVVPEPATVTAAGVVAWDDDGDVGLVRPDSITVHLLAGGKEVSSQEVSADDFGLWRFSFGEVPQDDGGVSIAYSVAVDEVFGYTSEYAQQVNDQGDYAFLITNTLVVQEEEKQLAEIKEAPEPKDLTYAGVAQALVRRGTANGGTVMYALGSNGTAQPAKTDFSAELPCGTAAGTYWVWYYAKGDMVHHDSDLARVQASIGKADQLIMARNVTGSVGETGKAVKATVVGAGDEEAMGALSYAVTSGADVASVNVSTGALTLRAPGTATVRVTAAATGNYNEATKDVTVTVAPAVHTVTFYEDTAGTKVWQTVELEDGVSLSGLADYGTTSEQLLSMPGYTFAGWATEPNIVVESYTKDGKLVEALQGKLVNWDAAATQDMDAYPIWIRDRLEVKLVPGGDEATPVTMGTGYDGKPQSTDFAVNIDEKLHMEGLNGATREGYKLVGWFTQGGVKWSEEGDWGVTPEYCEKDENGTPIMQTNVERKFNYYTVVLTARWTPNVPEPEGEPGEYTITFDSLGGTPVNPITQQSGTPITAPADPTKPHYDFDGWHPALPTVMPARNLTVLASWKPTTYHIAFDSAGGTEVGFISDMYGARVTPPNDPVKERAVFAGWMDEQGQPTAVPLYMPDTNPTLTAQWKVIPDAPNIEVEALDAYSVDVMNPVEGAEYIIMPYGQKPADEDWADAKRPSGTPSPNAMSAAAVTDGMGAAEAVADITFGNLSPVTSYDVWGRMVETEDSVASDGAKMTVTTLKEEQEAPAAPDAKAVGMDTIAVVEPSAAQEYAIALKDAALAIQEADLSWSSPDGDGVMQWAGLEPNTDYSIFARMAVTNTKNTSPASEPTTVRTLADQSRTHTVTWKNADGTTLQTETVLYGDTPVFQGETPKKAADVKYTYVFKGWTPAIARVTADVTYTATYDETVNKYKVTFVDYDGSTVLKETAEYDYGTPAANVKRPADPTREADAQHAYKFAGWTPEVADVTGDATYKATYAEVAKKGTLTFDLGGGTIEGKTSLTIEANVGDVITIPEAPVRDGYTFKYWKGSEYYPGDKYTVEGDHTFAAVWEKKSDGGSSGNSGSNTDTRGTSSNASGKSSAAKTGDELGGTIAALGITAACALCLAFFALYRRRRPDEEKRL